MARGGTSTQGPVSGAGSGNRRLSMQDEDAEHNFAKKGKWAQGFSTEVSSGEVVERVGTFFLQWKELSFSPVGPNEDYCLELSWACEPTGSLSSKRACSKRRSPRPLSLSGGLAMFWKDEISLNLQSVSKYHIDMIVEGEVQADHWRLTVIPHISVEESLKELIVLPISSRCVRVRTKHAGKDSWWFVRPVIILISSSGGTPGPGPGGLGSGCYKWYQSDLATVSAHVDSRRGAPRAPPSKGRFWD
ncbi:hypothetical protein PTKIN_Ptkin11bG0131200 [Pterospermum kingtungense]